MLSIDGVFQCYVLEPTWRPNGEKVPGQTAIPEGRYRLSRYHSPRLGYEVLLLGGVPGFDGVEVHIGNYPVDTHGCLLPGLSRTTDEVDHSRLAFSALMETVGPALDGSDGVWLTVRRAEGA